MRVIPRPCVHLCASKNKAKAHADLCKVRRAYKNKSRLCAKTVRSRARLDTNTCSKSLYTHFRSTCASSLLIARKESLAQTQMSHRCVDCLQALVVVVVVVVVAVAVAVGGDLSAAQKPRQMAATQRVAHNHPTHFASVLCGLVCERLCAVLTQRKTVHASESAVTQA